MGLRIEGGNRKGIVRTVALIIKKGIKDVSTAIAGNIKMGISLKISQEVIDAQIIILRESLKLL